jgi:hypothetical protein
VEEKSRERQEEKRKRRKMNRKGKRENWEILVFLFVS